MKKAKIYLDLSWNLLASFIFTGTTQLFVYPILASQMNESNFGTVLTIMGITNAIGTIFGGSLNNIRLLNWKKYKNKNLNGDFSILLLISLAIAAFCSIGSSFFFRKQLNLYKTLIVAIISLLITLRGYGTVYFRIKLDYFSIMKHMLYTSIGYFVGVVIFNLFEINWTGIFLIGEFFSIVYIAKNTPIFNESITKTNNLRNINRDYFQLTSSNLVANLLLYLDRLLINPILGPANVSIYFAASIVGKMAGIVLQPLSGVILSYISQNDESTGWKEFKITSIFSIISGALIFTISIVVAPMIIRILYAELYTGAIDFYVPATLGSILSICGSLIQPILLKYCKLKWQNVIQVIYGSIYILLGIFLMTSYGLAGFVYAVVIANLLRLLLILLIGYKNIKPLKKPKST